VGPGRLDVIGFDEQRELSMGTDESGGGVLPVRATSNAVYRMAYTLSLYALKPSPTVTWTKFRFDILLSSIKYVI
jgi:hypothetical protein